jgi:hypothetical protein
MTITQSSSSSLRLVLVVADGSQLSVLLGCDFIQQELPHLGSQAPSLRLLHQMTGPDGWQARPLPPNSFRAPQGHC